MSGRNTKSTQVKVKRYRAGQLPEGATAYDDYSSSEGENLNNETEVSKNTSLKQVINKNIKLEFKKDEKINGIQKTTLNLTDKKDISERYRQRELERDSDESESDSEKSEVSSDYQRDREHLKEVALINQNEQIKKKIEETETEEDEYETESSEESSEEDTRPLLKPVFVPKSQRVTIQEKEQREKEALELEKKKAEQLRKRKEESKLLVEQEIKRELEEAIMQAEIDAEIDDTDGLDIEGERQAWRLRELRRIKRDKEEKAEREKELAEIERRRNLTEEERIKEDMERVRKQMEEKEKLKETQNKSLLEKYHHKGAFFQDKDEAIFKRDFTQSRPDAIKNVESLPKVLQVKNFGLAGRTKYTHLADQDTSKFDSPWFQKDNPLLNRGLKRLGGLHDLDSVERMKNKKLDSKEQDKNERLED